MAQPQASRVFSHSICEACKTQFRRQKSWNFRRSITTSSWRPAPIRPPSEPSPKVDLNFASRKPDESRTDAESLRGQNGIVAQIQNLLVRDANATHSLFSNAPPVPHIHRIHVYSHKHNTHITFTRPNATDPVLPSAAISVSTGNLGFKKAARSTFDAAYQLSAYVLGRIQGEGLLAEIKELELVFRGFGIGREAFTKAIMGNEGRMIRGKVTALKDSTRLKFGGTRSKRPRRLG